MTLQCLYCGASLDDDYTHPVDAVLQRYYRRRAAGAWPRVTLRDMAKETGISYSTLTKRKMEYDRAGKWGAKHKVKL